MRVAWCVWLALCLIWAETAGGFCSFRRVHRWQRTELSKRGFQSTRLATAGGEERSLSLSAQAQHVADEHEALEQLLDGDPSDFATPIPATSSSSQGRRSIVVETPGILSPGTPLEYVQSGSLRFGNFARKCSEFSVVVIAESGEEDTIEIGQVVSVWDDMPTAYHPRSSAEWTEVSSAAFEMLGRLPPRKQDLEDFWQRVRAHGGPRLPVDSTDLGVYIFQESNFLSWISPMVVSEDDATLRREAWALTAAQRYAAALLLFQDQVLFRRAVSRAAWMEDVCAALFMDEPTLLSIFPPNNHSYILEGGYRVMSEAEASVRSAHHFHSYYKRVVHNSSQPSSTDAICPPFPRTAHQMRFLRALEFAATSAAAPSSPPLSRAVSIFLHLLHLPPTVQSVQSVLQALCYPLPRAPEPQAAIVSPWSADCLVAAKEVAKLSARHHQQLQDDILPASSASRIDLRGLRTSSSSSRDGGATRATTGPTFCIDTPRSTFLDDAISIDRPGGRILVHVVDVCAALQRAGRHAIPVEATAALRGESVFLPDSVHPMFPPVLLEEVGFSTMQPTEALTVAFPIDWATGKLLPGDVFPSIVGPVVALTHTEVEARLSSPTSRLETDPSPSSSLEHRDSIDEDLRLLQGIAARMTDIPSQRVQESEQLAAEVMGRFLTYYSRAAFEVCTRAGLAVPMSYAQRDPTDRSRPWRFATQPLRNYLSLLQQRQIRAALGLEAAVRRKDCAIAVEQYKKNRKIIAALLSRSAIL